MKKLILPALVVIGLPFLLYWLFQIGGALFLGVAWANQAETAEKEITAYVENVDVRELIEESKLFMEEAKKENKTYWTLSGDTMPEEWRKRKVSIIAYNQFSVDYSWTGGVLGRRGIMVTEENGDLRITAQLSPDEPSITLYPPKTEGITRVR